MTEDEAKTKWCPFARLMTANIRNSLGNPECPQPQTTFNRIGINGEKNPYIDDRCRCIASACMAWRWVEVIQQANHDPTLTRTVVAGYCGLAGKP